MGKYPGFGKRLYEYILQHPNYIHADFDNFHSFHQEVNLKDYMRDRMANHIDKILSSETAKISKILVTDTEEVMDLYVDLIKFDAYLNDVLSQGFYYASGQIFEDFNHGNNDLVQGFYSSSNSAGSLDNLRTLWISFMEDKFGSQSPYVKYLEFVKKLIKTRKQPLFLLDRELIFFVENLLQGLKSDNVFYPFDLFDTSSVAQGLITINLKLINKIKKLADAMKNEVFNQSRQMNLIGPDKQWKTIPETMKTISQQVGGFWNGTGARSIGQQIRGRMQEKVVDNTISKTDEYLSSLAGSMNKNVVSISVKMNKWKKKPERDTNARFRVSTKEYMVDYREEMLFAQAKLSIRNNFDMKYSEPKNKTSEVKEYIRQVPLDNEFTALQIYRAYKMSALDPYRIMVQNVLGGLAGDAEPASLEAYLDATKSSLAEGFLIKELASKKSTNLFIYISNTGKWYTLPVLISYLDETYYNLQQDISWEFIKGSNNFDKSAGYDPITLEPKRNVSLAISRFERANKILQDTEFLAWLNL